MEESINKKLSIQQLHKKCVRDTSKDSIVVEISILLCTLTVAVKTGVNLGSKKVFLKSRVLKHIYDKRTAQEYDFFLKSLYKVVKYPDMIFKNSGSKRGSKLFVKEIEGGLFCIVLEENVEDDCNYIVTCFKTKESYLVKFQEIWHWEGGDPPS